MIDKQSLIVTKKEVDIIKKALIEYEENHYKSENNQWQKRINKLFNNLKPKKVKEAYMTVGELIDKLKEFDINQEVVISLFPNMVEIDCVSQNPDEQKVVEIFLK